MSLVPQNACDYTNGMMTNELTIRNVLNDWRDDRAEIQKQGLELSFRISDLEKQNAALMEALKSAPPLPMRSNIDFWYGVYDEWRDKALALVEGDE